MDTRLEKWQREIKQFRLCFQGRTFRYFDNGYKRTSIFYLEEELENQDTRVTWRETVALVASYLARRTR